MPFIEHVHDQWRLQEAESPIESAHVQGYIKGKTIARLQVAGICLVLAMGYVGVSYYFSPSAQAAPDASPLQTKARATCALK